MKFRQVVLGSLVVLVLVMALSAGAMFAATPRNFGFLGNESPKRITTDPVPGGSRGREARIYFLKADLKEFQAKADKELKAERGWKREAHPDGSILFRRRPTETVWIQRADRLKDPKFQADVPRDRPAEWVVVRTVDPRARRLIRRKIVEWGKSFFGY